MLIKIFAINNYEVDGWVTSRAHLDYLNDFTPVSENIGDALAHDIIDHNLRLTEANLSELTAIGANLARDASFSIGAYGQDNLPFEIGREVGIYLWFCDGVLEPPCRSKPNEWLRSQYYYGDREPKINAFIDTEYYKAFGYDDEIIEVEFDYDACAEFALSYMAKGFNEAARKVRRYGCDTYSLFKQLSFEIDRATGEYDLVEAIDNDIEININFNYKLGVKSVTHRQDGKIIKRS